MEAFLLTLDVTIVVWLCWLVRKSAKSKVGVTLGWLGYRDNTQTAAINHTIQKGNKGPGRA